MTTYLTIALLISCICTVAIVLLRDAPARLRFYICLMLLACWLIPWHLLQFQVVADTFTLPLNILSELSWVNTTGLETQNTQLAAPLMEQSYTSLITFYWLSIFAVGLVLFVKDVVGYVKLHNHWMKHSKLDTQTWKIAQTTQPNCDIRRIKTQAPGMTTGLTKPIIWLDNEQHDAEKIRTIVLHELTHIRQHDPYWLWAINLVQRLFWWNPLIGLTANYARQQIELSCDEQCKKHLPEGSYQLQLIKLTLQVNKQQHALKMPVVLQISATQAFNLQRINKLNEEHKMKKRYVLVIVSLLSLTGWIGFSNATVNAQQSVNHMDETTSLVDVIHTINSKDFTEAEILLEKLASNINAFTSSEQAKIWKLHAHVLYELDAKNPQIITYIDKAIALENDLNTTELLPILNMAQALAASQERWQEQLNYANKWFDIADDNVDKKRLLYVTAVSNFSLEKYDISISLLNELILISGSQGLQPKENWLNLLLANYIEGENTTQAIAIQKKITMLYPTEKNEKQLKNMSTML